MATTDQALLTEIQYALVEPTVDGGVTWSALWTAGEVVLAANRQQRRFLKDTFCVLSRAVLATVPNTHRHALPADWAATVTAAWQRPSGTTYPLMAETQADAALAVPTWQYDTVQDPLVYSEVELPTLQIQVLPASFDAGLIDLLYQAIGPALSGAGVSLTVPDDCVWIVKWGILADLLDKVGRSADPARAAYAASRYRFGVELVRQILLGGWY